MQQCSLFLGVMGPLLLTGCSSSGSTPGTITEEEYRQDLQIQTSVEDQQLVVSVSTADAPNNLRDVRRVFLITETGEHALGESSGLLGPRITLNVSLAAYGGDLGSFKKIEVRYEVWDGFPSKGTKLFEGKKEVTITSGSE